MRRVIRLGDRTTHGGEVVSAADNYFIMGKAVARMGDMATCPIKGHGVCEIVEGDPTWTINGRNVALEGHKLQCGAELISSCGEVGRSYDGDGVAASVPVFDAEKINRALRTKTPTELGFASNEAKSNLMPDAPPKFLAESREETMRRICKYAESPWDGHVPRDPSNWHDLNQRNAEHYYFGNELGRRFGPLASVMVGLYEAGKYVRNIFGGTTRPTPLGLEMGMRGVVDGWIYRRPHPEECGHAK